MAQKTLVNPVIQAKEAESVVGATDADLVEEHPVEEPVVADGDADPVVVQEVVQDRDTFKCKETKACKRIFMTREGLNNHIKQCHNSQKQYVCPECGKSFPRMQRLAVHQESHVVKPTISCDICGKEVKNNYRLKQHIEKYHEEANVKCNICDKTFLHKIDLRKHKKNCLKQRNKLKNTTNIDKKK